MMLDRSRVHARMVRAGPVTDVKYFNRIFLDGFVDIFHQIWHTHPLPQGRGRLDHTFFTTQALCGADACPEPQITGNSDDTKKRYDLDALENQPKNYREKNCSEKFGGKTIFFSWQNVAQSCESNILGTRRLTQELSFAQTLTCGPSCTFKAAPTPWPVPCW